MERVKALEPNREAILDALSPLGTVGNGVISHILHCLLLLPSGSLVIESPGIETNEEVPSSPWGNSGVARFGDGFELLAL